MKRNGFSLLEAMIAMGLSLLVLTAAFEFVGITKSLFLKLKEAQETNQAAQAALTKLRIDLLRAGFGLEAPLRAGIFNGIDIAGTSLSIVTLDKLFALSADAFLGEHRILLERVSGLSQGRRVCLVDVEKTEVHTIAAIEGNTVVFAAPLQASYPATAAQVLLLEDVSYFLDERGGILRRKVNASPAQPLLDDAGLFVPVYEREDNLARITLAGRVHQERIYELFVFPKNLGLVHP